MLVDIQVPALGKNIDHAVIGRWYYESGDFVRKDDPIVELESDKVNMELVAPASGLLSPTALMGDTVKVGAVVGRIEPAAPPPVPEFHPSSSDAPIVIPSTSGWKPGEMQLGRWCKKDGEMVSKGEPVVEIETDKVVFELTAPTSGRLRMIARPGSAVRVSERLGIIQAVVG